MKEDEILNCPDCQLQTLQQQQKSFPGHRPRIHPPHVQQVLSIQSPKEHAVHQLFQNSRDSSSCDLQNLNNEVNNVLMGSVGVGGAVTYQSQNNISYKNDGGLSSGAGVTCNPHPVSSTMSIVPKLMLSGSGVSASNSSPLNSNKMMPNNSITTGASLPQLPLEDCDIGNYYTTCTVLDLPTNEKYYRASIPRHSVFPPMFYGQAPPIPGYSPIPDCNLWANCNSNDFPYSYSAYSQPQQQASSNDYYTPTSVTSVQPNLQSPSGDSTNHQTHSMNSCSFSFSNNSLGTINVLESTDYYKTSDVSILVGNNNMDSKKSQIVEVSTREDHQDHDDSLIPISISSSSDDTSDSGSVSGSFISQREVIVEDEDSVSMTMCHMDPSQKCTICQHPLMSNCSSPQLENILENMNDEITAEDLDMTVSSGDIEIGGIEDEVRDYHPKKSSFHYNGSQISMSRLAYLLNIPLEIILTLSNSNSSPSQDPQGQGQGQGRDHDIVGDPSARTVLLCSNCNRLATIMDSLEKQLRSTCATIKEFLEPHILLYHPSSQPLSHVQSMNKKCVLELESSIQKVQIIPSSSDECKKSQDSEHSIRCSTQKTICTSAWTQTEFITPAPAEPPNPVHPFENINLECDIHDINCSFIPELRRDEEADPEFPPSAMFTSIQGKETAVEFPQEDNTDATATAIEDTQAEEEGLQCHESYLCELCGIILSSPRTFEIHSKRHRNELVHKCSECGKGFVSEASLQDHVRSHTGHKPFPCFGCGKAFGTKSNMLAHQATCSEFQVEPNTKCGQKLKNNNNNRNSFISVPLKSGSHNTSTLPEPVPPMKLYCDACGLCFRLKKRLRTHLLKGCKSSKVVECSHSNCKKKFCKISEMKVHMLVHNGDKPYVCTVCGRNFATKGNQIAHSRTHLVEKRFICQICNKGFNRKQALQLHFNRHNGIKPYECEICDRKFSDPSNLQNHKKIHKKKNT